MVAYSRKRGLRRMRRGARAPRRPCEPHSVESALGLKCAGSSGSRGSSGSGSRSLAFAQSASCNLQDCAPRAKTVCPWLRHLQAARGAVTNDMNDVVRSDAYEYVRRLAGLRHVT